MKLQDYSKKMSPILRFGGKFYISNQIISYFPQVDTIISPFLGAGWIELKCAANGIQIIGNDIDSYAINVFKQFQDNKNELLDIIVENYINISKEHWFELKSEYLNNQFTFDVEGAAKYISLNRSSYSGIMSKGMGFSRGGMNATKNYRFKHRNRWMVINQAKIKNWDNLEYKPFILSNKDWYDFLRDQDKEAFIYLDPPYYKIKGKYPVDFEDEDHEELRGFLETRPNWILSYKYHPYLLKLYDGFKIKKIETYNYSSGRYQSYVPARELLIMSRNF